jgi:hypothetical protein
MSGYRKRADRLDNPGPLLGKLRAVREELLKTCSTVKPFGTIYHGLSMVVTAIDSLAVLLTSDKDYFMALGSAAGDGQLEAEAEKLRREKPE